MWLKLKDFTRELLLNKEFNSICDMIIIEIVFVDLKSNSALLYNKGHDFWKSVSTRWIPQNWIFLY